MARDTARRVALAAVALLFFATAVVFATVAAFLWLSTVIAPPLAGLSLAAILLLIAIIFLLLAGRRRQPLHGTEAATPLTALAGEAEEVGRRLGRDANGSSLLLVALAIGIVLGSLRR